MKVLIADDEPIFRMGLQKMIATLSSGWHVVGEAEDGQDAWAKVKSLRPDVLLTDIRMPRMDGIQLQRLVKEHYPQMACIVLSGHDEFAYARDSLKLGAKDYLLKPVEREQLYAALEKVRAEWQDRLPGAGGQTEREWTVTAVDRAILYIRQHYTEELSLSQVAAQVHLNPSYLSTLFKQKAGVSFVAFLQQTRIGAAKRLLRQTDLKIQAIAEQTGFSSLRHFNRAFKEEVGVTPRSYRESLRRLTGP